MIRRPRRSPLFPYTTLFGSVTQDRAARRGVERGVGLAVDLGLVVGAHRGVLGADAQGVVGLADAVVGGGPQGHADRVVPDPRARRGGGGQAVVERVTQDPAAQRGVERGGRSEEGLGGEGGSPRWAPCAYKKRVGGLAGGGVGRGIQGTRGRDVA